MSPYARAGRLRAALGAATLGLLTGLGACSGGGDRGCDGGCAAERLELADVERVLAQGIAEAGARAAPATFAVSDRVGNVLGVYRMSGAGAGVTIDSGRGVEGGLEQINVVPASLAAIAKALTGAYLSSQGNAFTSRTASQIVQQHFNVGEVEQPGGPLFGVQFSSLPCSDLALRFSGGAAGAGPQRSPLGLSADPGGLPLYKNGVLVGGIGVAADGRYGLDLDISDDDADLDELIALAAQAGFAPPQDRRADRITVDGKTLRYSDAEPRELLSAPAAAPAFAVVGPASGALVAVPGYSTATLRAGTAFGEPASGIRPATGALAGLGADVLVDDADAERFPPRGGSDLGVLGADALSQTEVTTLLRQAIALANRTRGQIRRPLGSQAHVTVAVVDTYGTALGLLRTGDAPVFGTDVALQKARGAAFFSGSDAAADLRATPPAHYFASGSTSSIADYVDALRATLGRPAALSDGAIAFGARSIGNLARPYLPDGQRGSGPGPLSKRFEQWSPFSTGLQLDLVNAAILRHVVFVLGGGADVAPGACTEMPITPTGLSRLANGLQIFSGGVPIYRGNRLVGAIGVSGDGIDQDDMIAFLGLHQAGLALSGALGNAPEAQRADRLAVPGGQLRYVQCPQAPFLDSEAHDVCAGK